MSLRRPALYKHATQPVDICKAHRFLKLGRLAGMGWWSPCRLLLYSYRRRRAAAVMRMWRPLEVGTRRVLLLRAADGVVFQVAGDVGKVVAREGHY